MYNDYLMEDTVNMFYGLPVFESGEVSNNVKEVVEKKNIARLRDIIIAQISVHVDSLADKYVHYALSHGISESELYTQFQPKYKFTANRSE